MHKTGLSTLVVMLMLLANAVSASPRISWITCGPGSDVYELEGHSGIRIVTDSTDYIVNWGLFDFNAPAFVWRFALGQTNYKVGISNTEAFINSYSRAGRSVTEMPLNLDSISAMRLISMVDSTLMPGKDIYRYNFCKDNCATRPLDYIMRASSRPIKLNLADTNPSVSFRDEMRHYHSDYPWYQFGIDLALGSILDLPINAIDRGFAPVTMHQIVKCATFDDGTPLVCSEQVLTVENLHTPTTTIFSPLVCGLLLLIIVMLIGYHDIKHRKLSRWLQCIFFTVEGVAGCIIAFLIFVSTHYATSPNWVLLWLNPIAFLPAVGVWFRGIHKILDIYHALNIIALLILTVIFITGIQIANIAFFPIMLSSALLSAIYLKIK